MSIDLHTHTTASDGTRTPVELVDFAAACGCTTLAITDHDSVDGVKQGMVRAAYHGMEFIPGVELNTDLPDGREVHMLGYYIDVQSDRLLSFMADRVQMRLRRVSLMIDRLRELGFPLDRDEVIALAGGEVVTRSHVAQAMALKGYVPDTQTALKRFLKTGGPAYVPRDGFEPTAAVRLIRAVGGVAVLAHPGLYAGEEIVPACVEAGMAGLEVYYRAHTPDQVERYEQLASSYGLLRTGGTDAHGPGTGRDYRIGDVAIPPEILHPLREIGSRK